MWVSVDWQKYPTNLHFEGHLHCCSSPGRWCACGQSPVLLPGWSSSWAHVSTSSCCISNFSVSESQAKHMCNSKVGSANFFCKSPSLLGLDVVRVRYKFKFVFVSPQFASSFSSWLPTLLTHSDVWLPARYRTYSLLEASLCYRMNVINCELFVWKKCCQLN